MRHNRFPQNGSFRIGLTFVVVALGYGSMRLGPVWCSNSDYESGWLIPILAVLLFLERCRDSPAPIVPAAGFKGLVMAPAFLTTLGLGAIALEVLPEWRLGGWLFSLSLVGLVMQALYNLGGKPWAHHFAFPACFFLIGVPWPSRIEEPIVQLLSDCSATGSCSIANLLGSPAVRAGAVIQTAAGPVGVDRACSGILSFHASIMMALFLGELFRFRWLLRSILAGAAVAIALCGNVIRTAYLVRVSDVSGLNELSARHDSAALAILGFTLATLTGMAWLLRAFRRRESPTTPISQPSPALSPVQLRRLLAHFIGIVIVVVAFEGMREWWFRSANNDQNNAEAGWDVLFAVDNPGAMARTDHLRNVLRFDEGRSAEWRDDQGLHWQAFFFRWKAARNQFRAAQSTIQAKGHVPAVCLRNVGMLLEKDYGERVWRVNNINLRVTLSRFRDRGHSLHVMSCYWESCDPEILAASLNREAASPFRTAMRAFRMRERGRCEKRVIKMGVWDSEEQDAEELLRQALARFIHPA